MKLYVGNKTVATIYMVGMSLCIWIVAGWVAWRWCDPPLVVLCTLFAIPATMFAELWSMDLARRTREIVSEWED